MLFKWQMILFLFIRIFERRIQFKLQMILFLFTNTEEESLSDLLRHSK